MKFFIIKFVLVLQVLSCTLAYGETLGEVPVPGNTAQSSTEPSNTALSGDPFVQAEYLFHSGNLLGAKPFYHDYLSRYSSGKRSYLALFRLGLIDQSNHSYSTAIRFYQILLEKFPRSLQANLAKYNMAVCYQELANYAQAEAMYQNVFRSTSDKKLKWEIMYRLAQINGSQMDYEEAFSKLKKIYDQIEYKDIHEQAVEVAEGLINNKLGATQVTALIQKLGGSFPVDLLLLKKISLFRESGDIPNYVASVEKFIEMFPVHARKAEAEGWLSQLKKDDESKIKIGVVLPLTGNLAQTGQRVLQGIQLALNQLSFKSVGKPVLEVRDSGSHVSIDDIITELAQLPNVVGIIGPLLSDEVKTAGKVALKYKMPIFSPTASTQGLVDENPYVFRNALTREIQAKFLAEYSVNTLHLKRFAVLYPLESFGLELKNMFIDEVESLGGEVVAVSGYDRSQNDFKKQILELGGVEDDELARIAREIVLNDEQVKDFSDASVLSRPIIDMGHWAEKDVEKLKASLEMSYEALFIPGVYDKVGLIIPQLAFYNVANVTLLGTNGWNSPELVDMGGKYLKLVYFVDGYYPDSHQSEVRQFVQKFKSSFGEEPVYLSAQAFDAANIVLKNITMGANDRIKMWEKMKTVKDFPGVTGNTTLLPSGDSEKNIFALTVKRKKIIQDN